MSETPGDESAAPSPSIGWLENLFDEEQRISICLALSAVLVIINGHTLWWVKGPCYALMVAALAVPVLQTRPWLWFATAFFVGCGTINEWATADNHKYLMAYWLIAVGCVCVAKADFRREVLYSNGRWLMVAVMGFATFWKLTSSSYMLGDFFEYTFLTDQRFRGFVAFMTDVSPQQLAENTALVDRLHFSPELDLSPHSLNTSSQVHWLARLTTWWTVLIEGTTMVLFLLPTKFKYGWLRHVVLLGFAATTYAIAPVAGFGCLLMLLGMSQCIDRHKSFFSVYVAMFIAIEVAAVVVGPVWQMLG